MLIAQILAIVDEQSAVWVGRGQVEIAPIDADIVALLAQDFLVLTSGCQYGHATGCLPFLGDERLARIVQAPSGRQAEIDFGRMFLIVVEIDFVVNISDRTAHQAQIVHQ